MNTGNGGPTRQDSYFLSPFILKTREMAYPAPTKGRSKLSPNAAMLFAPFGCTHPPPPAPPFLLAQSLSLKDIAGCDIMKLKVSRCRYATLGLKGLTITNSYLPRDFECFQVRNVITYAVMLTVYIREFCQVSPGPLPHSTCGPGYEATGIHW